MVADAQGETGSQHTVLQGIVKPPQGDALRIRAKAEHRNRAGASGRKGHGAIFHHSYQIIPAYQITGSVVIRQKLQGLEIGNGMIQPRAVQTAVKQKLPVSQGKSPAGGQHGIGIILFHREHIGPLRNKAQGIKVP